MATPTNDGFAFTFIAESGLTCGVEARPVEGGWQATAYRADGSFPVTNLAHSASMSPFPTQSEAIGACVANLVGFLIGSEEADKGSFSPNYSYMLTYDPVDLTGGNWTEGEHDIWTEEEAQEKARAMIDSGKAKMVNIWAIGDTGTQDHCIAHVGPDPDESTPFPIGPDGKYEGTDITPGQLVIPRRGF
jgi:hypothetical protein